MNDKQLKERAQKLIDIFIAQIVSPHDDAGWHQPSQLEWLQQACNKKQGFRVKQISAGFKASDEHQANDTSDMKMVKEIRYLRNQHHDFKLAVMLLKRLSDKHAEAVLAGPYLKAVHKRPLKDREVAENLGVAIHVYRRAKHSGYECLVRELGLVKVYLAEVA